MADNIIVNTITETQVISIAEQGPPGIPGEDSSIYVTADVDLGGHRVVKATSTGCDYADNTTISDINSILGITDSATVQGGSAKIRTSGELIEPSWNFSIGAVYLGTNGLLIQTVPSSGFIKQIGVAVSATK
jgi:hypothetical protein